jgi:hypothetical protein
VKIDSNLPSPGRFRAGLLELKFAENMASSEKLVPFSEIFLCGFFGTGCHLGPRASEPLIHEIVRLQGHGIYALDASVVHSEVKHMRAAMDARVDAASNHLHQKPVRRQPQLIGVLASKPNSMLSRVEGSHGDSTSKLSRS